jgi:hypothetical protein
MKFSREQQEILKMVFNLTQRGNSQPRPILFETIISEFTPEDCFVNFSRDIEGFRIFIYNNKIKDEKEVDRINGKILTYLFLIDQLVKNNYIIIYKLKNNFNYKNVFLPDKSGKPFDNAPGTGQFISEALYSPTFWEIIEKYGNTVIQPSYSLIYLIHNGFKTDSEKATEKSLRKTGTGLILSGIALIISLIAFIASIYIDYNALKINERLEQISIESFDISKKSLEISKESATEQKQIEIINQVDSIPIKLDRIKQNKPIK